MPTPLQAHDNVPDVAAYPNGNSLLPPRPGLSAASRLARSSLRDGGKSDEGLDLIEVFHRRHPDLSLMVVV